MSRSRIGFRSVIAVVISLLVLTLSLTFPNVQAGPKIAGTSRSASTVPAAQVFERKRSDGETLARLRISSANSPTKIDFQIDDLESSSRSVGTVRINSRVVKVRFTDPGSKARLGIDVRPDQNTRGKTAITLIYGKNRCDVAIDSKTARTLGGRIKELVDQRKRAEADQLLPLLRATLSGGDDYVAFAKLVASSSAFGILSATVALKATLNEEELRRNVALQAITTTASMLAPRAVKSTFELPQQPIRIQAQQQPRLVKASYSPAPFKAAVSRPSVPLHNEVQCNLCPLWFAGILGGCWAEWSWCRSFFPEVDWWLCDSSLFFCIDSAVLFLIWCENTYCHAHPNPPTNPSASGNDIQPGEALYADQSITSSNGLYTFIMQGDGNLVLYRNSDGTPLWHSGTHGNSGAYCILYADGEFTIKGADGSILWYLPFLNSPGSYLIVQDDGNVVIYRPDGGVVWATNTVQ